VVYLQLQVSKRRSFFVYAHDLGVLWHVEAQMKSKWEERWGKDLVHEGVGLGRMVRSVRGVGASARGGVARACGR
jgi:hypothetical protein